MIYWFKIAKRSYNLETMIFTNVVRIVNIEKVAHKDLKYLEVNVIIMYRAI